MLKSRGSVHWPLVPQSGHTISDIGTASGSSSPFLAAYASMQVVLPMSLVAVQAFDERIVEDLHVTGAHPHLRAAG